MDEGPGEAATTLLQIKNAFLCDFTPFLQSTGFDEGPNMEIVGIRIEFGVQLPSSAPGDQLPIYSENI